MIRFESEGFKQESDSCDAQGDISFSEILSTGGRGHKMRLPGSQRLPIPLLGRSKTIAILHCRKRIYDRSTSEKECRIGV